MSRLPAPPATAPAPPAAAPFDFDTPWTLLGALHADTPSARDEARAQLCARYRPAVVAFLRCKGEDADRADEIAQGFFADVVLGRGVRGVFDVACKEPGRKLRSLLMTSVEHYRTSVFRKERVRAATTTAGSGCNGAAASFDPDCHGTASGGAGDAVDAFDREWAATVLRDALARCERRFRDSGKERHWEAFAARELRPLTMPGTVPEPLKELATRLGWRTAADAGAAVQYVRDRLAEAVRVELARFTSDGEDEVRKELREWRRVLA